MSAPDNAYYDDEFDAYDEDFDDFDTEENEEESVAHDDQSQANPEPEVSQTSSEEDIRDKDRKGNVNQTYIIQKMLRRAKDIKELIDFDVAIYDIFEMTPLNEYEQYIRDFGSSNTAQASTQCNEDNAEVEIQTDDWFVEDKWTQAPQEAMKDCESGRPDLPSLDLERISWDRQEKKSMVQQKRVNATTLDSISLVRFIKSAGQVMDVLLEENTLGQAGYCETGDASNLRISHGMIKLKLQSVFGRRSVIKAAYSDIDYRTLVTSWSLPDEPKSNLDFKGILTVYRFTDSVAPQQILLCDSAITTFLVPQQAPHLVLAGTVDGGISLFDLRESDPPTAYPELKKVPHKLPTYCVDGLFGLDTFHCTPIVAILEIRNAEEASEESFSEFKDSHTFQVISMDDAGHVQHWHVLEISSLESQKYSDSDYGLAIGGKVRMVRGPDFDVDNNPEETKCIQITAADMNPSSPDKLLMGTKTGLIHNESRFRNTSFPAEFRTTHSSLHASDHVTSLASNPHTPRVFLGTYTSGCIALFSTSTALPLMTWKLSASALLARWSRHRPSVFYVLDAKSVLHVWDLLEQEAAPTFVVAVANEAGKKNRAVIVALSPALMSTGAASGSSATASTSSLASSANRNASLAIGYSNGDLEVHFLNEELVEQMVDEAEQFDQWVIGQMGKSK
ncbi:hypothetical protein BC830DRAFT_1109188 [Chytriomyces sp. MP71]|nr:hypothetical protein BC830DRAFT_1109188 [Chytriomyces sp. MP71]